MKTTIKTFALVALVAAAGAASAQQTATGTIANSLTITALCTVAVDGGTASSNSLGAISKSMGTLSQNGTAMNTTSAGSGGSSTIYGVTCGSGVNYTLTFDEGQNKATTSLPASPARRLALTIGSGPTATTNYINYNLFNGTGTTTPVGTITGVGNATGAADSYTIYGKVTDTTTSASHPAGTYKDVVNVTLSYS